MHLIKKIIFILAASLFLSMPGFSQDLLMRSAESRYVSGINGFLAMLRNNIKFPAESANNNSMGFSISGIEITPDGEIGKIEIINPVDPYIDALIIKTLAGTKGKWMNDRSTDENLLIIVQVCFLPFPKGYIPICESPVDLPAFLPPVTIINMAISETAPLSDEALSEILNRNRTSENSDSTFMAINELIRRNPFNPDLYQYRIFLNNKLGNKEMVLKDLNRINNFAGGKSLQKLITKFYDSNGVEISEEEAVSREVFSDLDNGFKTVTKLNYKGDTLEFATLKSDNPEIREGITRVYEKGSLKRELQFENNHINGYLTEYTQERRPESISLVLMDTVRAVLFSELDERAVFTDPGLFYPFDKIPSFKKGGIEYFRKWLQKKLRYPDMGREGAIAGKVYLAFIVEPDGSVSNATALQSGHPMFEAEALKVINSSPRWTPAYLDGKPVRSAVTITANFEPK